MTAAADHGVPAGPEQSGGLVNRWRRWRNRTVADPGFQRWALRMPGLSWIARRKSEALFRMTSGFVQSQILAASVESGLLSALQDGGKETSRIVSALAMPPDAADRLLRAAVAAKLIEQDRGGYWWLSEMGAVAAANPGIEAMIRHHTMLYRDLSDPVHLLHDPQAPTETHRFWSYAGTEAPQIASEDAAAYSRLMRLSQDLVSEELLVAYPFGRHDLVLDVGGGDGAFLEALLKRYPNPQAALFDLPPVAERAARRISESPGPRFACKGGDFFADPLPPTDCVTLVRVLCDHDDGPAARLLANIRCSIKPGGRIVLAEAMAGDGPGEALAAAYFGFYFLAMRSGRCRTPEEIGDLLRAAGFSDPRRRPTRNPLIASVMTADA